jgi:putative effector of murein hydrolase
MKNLYLKPIIFAILFVLFGVAIQVLDFNGYFGDNSNLVTKLQLTVIIMVISLVFVGRSIIKNKTSV